MMTLSEVLDHLARRRFVARLQIGHNVAADVDLPLEAVLMCIRGTKSATDATVFEDTIGPALVNFTLSKSESAHEAGEASRPRWTGQCAHYVVWIGNTGQPSVSILQENGTVDCAFPLPSLEALAEFVTGWRPGLPDDDLKSLVLRSRRDKPSPQTQSEHNPSDSSPDKS